jgi:hypothetical protein
MSAPAQVVAGAPELLADLRAKMALLEYPEAALCRSHSSMYGERVSALEDLSAADVELWLGTIDFALRRRAMECAGARPLEGTR